MVGKFLFDLSQPITDHGGDIFQFTVDGLVAIWDWPDAIESNHIVGAVGAMYAAIAKAGPSYRELFGRVPEFRVGVHGGEVVLSEQGDAKRSIGVYGDPIIIAARMEQTAKAIGESCVISADVVEALESKPDGVTFLGEKRVKGHSVPIGIYKFVPPDAD